MQLPTPTRGPDEPDPQPTDDGADDAVLVAVVARPTTHRSSSGGTSDRDTSHRDTAGRAAAWQTLVRRHSPRMYAVARSFRLDEATAEDLVQTAWLRLLQHTDDLRDAASVGPWLTTVVRNEARRLVTRRRELPWSFEPGAGSTSGAVGLELGPDVVLGGLVGPDEPSAAADAALLAADDAAAVRTAFARLGAECQQLLRLVLADPPIGYDEIAKVVGRPRGSLGPTRRRCLDQLRGLLPAGYER